MYMCMFSVINIGTLFPDTDLNFVSNLFVIYFALMYYD